MAAAARRRLMLRRLVTLLGPALVAAGAAALLLVGATRLWPDFGPWPLWAGACIALGVLGAIGAALARRPSLLSSAAAVDAAMRLRDRLTNGVALAKAARGENREPFATLALQDAEHAAREADVRKALPIRFGPSWGWAPAVIAAALAVGLFVPQRTPAAPSTAADQGRQEEREHAVAAIQQVINEVRDEAAPEEMDPATRERLEALEELERQLLDGHLEPGEATDEAIRTLAEAAEREQEQARRALAAQEALRERLAQGARPGQDESPLARALREGDLASAQREAESLLNRREQLTAEEAGRVAEDLRQLAEALRDQQESTQASEPPERLTQEAQPPAEASEDTPTPPAGEQTRQVPEEDPSRSAQSPQGETPEQDEQEQQPQQQPPQSPLEEALRQQGVPPEEARELAEQPNPEQVREALEQQGVDPQVADDIAEQADRERQRREAQEQAEEQSRRLSEALERAAESLERRHRPQPQQREGQQTQEQQQQQQQQQQAPGRPGQEQSAEQQQPQSGQQQPNAEQQQPSQEPGAQQQPTQQQGEQQQGQQQQQEPASTPDGQQPGMQQQPSQSGQQQSTPSPDGQSQEQHQQQQPGAQPDQQPSPEPGAQPGEQPKTAPQSGQQPGDQQTDGLQQLMQELQRQQQQGQSSEQSQRNAERLREQARRMLENASPEERERLQRWAQQAAQEQDGLPPGGRAPGDGPRPPLPGVQPPPSDFQQEVVDARGESPAGSEPRREQVIAEWYSDRPTEPGQSGSAAASEAISRARRAAERDMGNRTIHPRYHDLLREYFKRLPDPATGGAPQPSGSPGAGGSQ